MSTQEIRDPIHNFIRLEPEEIKFWIVLLFRGFGISISSL